MRKVGMVTRDRLVLRSPRLWNEPSLQARVDELIALDNPAMALEAQLERMSEETGFSLEDLHDLVGVARCWRALHAATTPALAA